MTDEEWNDLSVILANSDAHSRDIELAMCECNFDAKCRQAIAKRLVREFGKWRVIED